MSGARPLHVVVVGGGLAGISAALACADTGAAVTLLERRSRLGGLTWSWARDGITVDNGQHVFLRCCTAYLDFLDRIGSAGDVEVQDRLDLTVLRPRGGGRSPIAARLRRNGLPAPLHLAASLATYGHLRWTDRLRVGPAAAALGRLDLHDPTLDTQTFGAWLSTHGQSPAAQRALWDLICLPTVNLPAAEASLAVAAKVFQTGLLGQAGAADVGWSRVPLGQLHGERCESALAKAGVVVSRQQRVRAVAADPVGGDFVVRTEAAELRADAVVVALPHQSVSEVLPSGALAPGVEPQALGSSPILDVHVHYDRRVMDLPVAAGLDSPVQWVFDRTKTSGADRGQYLAVSVSAAEAEIGRRPEDLASRMTAALADLFPAARDAVVLDTLVTREHHATFRATPGSAVHRAPARTRIPGLALAGAWTDTGWPATMEGAVRSGITAARVALIGAGHRTALPKEAA
jgi:squalene-associated FAD-dependent desaturase